MPELTTANTATEVDVDNDYLPMVNVSATPDTIEKLPPALLLGNNLKQIRALADPNADKVIGWDDSAGHMAWFDPPGVPGGGIDFGTEITDATDFNALITTATGDPTTIYHGIITAGFSISAAFTVPANLYFLFAKGAVITDGGGGTIDFDGIGLLDPESREPLFSGFAAGDITWTGTDWPRRITAELWDTGNNSYADRVNRVDAAMSGKHCQIVCYPRQLSPTEAIVTEHHHILNMPGEYPNIYQFTGSNRSPVILRDNTSFRSVPGAIIYESSVVGVNNSPIVSAAAVSDDPDDIVENVFIEDNYFKGNASQAYTSGPSTTYLGNVHHGGINRNTFDHTHGYNLIGGFGGLGNCADGFTFDDNKFLGLATQAQAVLNARNGSIRNNYHDLAGANSTTAFTSVDIEPNVGDEQIANITVEGNHINGVAETVNYWTGILVHDLTVAGNTGIIIRNNTVIGAEPVGAAPGRLIVGIQASGCGMDVINNTVRGATQAPIRVFGRGNRIKNNHIDASTDGNAFKSQILLSGVSDSVVIDNDLTTMPLVTGISQLTGIYEMELWRSCTTSGSTITLLNPDIAWFDFRFFGYSKGLRVWINGSEHTLDTITSSFVMTATASLGTLIEKTFATTDVDTTNNLITYTSHPFNDNAFVRLSTTGTLPAHTAPTPPPGITEPIYMVAVDDADHIELHDPNTGAVIDFTTQGTGTHKLTPVLMSRYSSNRYVNNLAPDGITLWKSAEPWGGRSQIISTADDGYATEISDTDHTASRGAGVIRYTLLSNSRTVTLPSAVGLKGKTIRIEDATGSAETHAIVIDGSGSETVNGAASQSIVLDYGWAEVCSDGANWMIKRSNLAMPEVPFVPSQLEHIVADWNVASLSALADNDPVSTWADDIGSADFTAASTVRPLYKTNGGDPYIEADGSNDEMTATWPALTDFVIVAVFERVTTGNYARLLNDSGDILRCTQSGTSNAQLLIPSSGNFVEAATPAPPSGFLGMVVKRIGSTGSIRINGSQDTDTIVTTATGATMHLFANASGAENGNLRLKRLILCDADFEANEFAWLRQYILRTYSVTL